MRKNCLIILIFLIVSGVLMAKEEKIIISYIDFRVGAWSLKNNKSELKMMNDVLSRKRADMAYDYMVDRLGIPKERFIVRYRGRINPIDNRDLDIAYRKNRRTELWTYIDSDRIDKIEASILKEYKSSLGKTFKIKYHYDLADWAVSEYYKEIQALINLIKMEKINLDDIIIEGHTDRIGILKENVEMSKRRVESVEKYFWYNNINTVSTKYYANERPEGKKKQKIDVQL